MTDLEGVEPTVCSLWAVAFAVVHLFVSLPVYHPPPSLPQSYCINTEAKHLQGHISSQQKTSICSILKEVSQSTFNFGNYVTWSLI